MVSSTPPAPRRHSLALLTLAFAALSGPVLAQSISSGTIDRVVAGQTVILQRFTPPAQAGSVGIAVEDQRGRLDIKAARAVRFRLRALSIDGAAVVPAGDLARLWQDRIGQQITLADLYKIAEAVDAAYLAAGYFSKTVVPVQDFTSGRVRLQVYEGYVARIEITSDIAGIERRLAPYLDRILAMHPIRVAEAERVLLLMSDLGGLEIEGTFVRPDKPTGGGLLKLDIAQQRRSGTIALDNFGSEAVGPVEIAGNLKLNDVFGRFETTTLTGVTIPDDPRELGLIQIAQDYPIGHDGLVAGFSLTHLRQRPGGSLAAQDIDVASTIGTTSLSYPLLRRLEASLFARLELTARNDDVDAGGNPVARGKTRWATASLQYDRTLKAGSLTAEGGLSFGNASDIDMGNVPGDFQFLTAGLDYTRPLGEDTQFRLRASGQYSPRALPGAVQFALGGDPYGWAFDNGSLSGDSGAAVAIEIGHDIDTGLAQLPGLSLSAFADFGTVWNRDAGGGPGRESLGSYGLGISGLLADRVRFQIIAALPWTTPDSLEDTGRKLLFRLVIPL